MCTNAIVVFEDVNARGTIRFHQCKNEQKTILRFDLHSLPKNKKIACHIHEFGDKSNGCTSLGGHWNPTNKQHGSRSLNENNRHAGDLLNNITSDGNGKFNYEYTDDLIKLRGDIMQSIFGRSVVLHEGVDDLGLGLDVNSKINGNAGGRMACGIIGICK
jgi:Cu-Zn family superoxide dismutase